ncbi:MAG: helix-turn-helix transcriptional regulator [Pseudomonadota bacterium]
MCAERARKAPAKTTDDATKELRRKLGRWLKEHREERGLTQADLAERLGLRYYSFISQVENGLGRIPQDLYAPWAAALDIDPRIFAWTVLAHLEPGLYGMLDADAPTLTQPKKRA